MGKRREERIIYNAIGDEVHIFGNDWEEDEEYDEDEDDEE